MRRLFIRCVHTIIGRVTLHVALFSVVTILVIFTVFLHMEKRKLADGAARYTMAEMDAIASHIDDELHAVEKGIDKYTWMCSSSETHPDSLYECMDRIMECNDDIRACAIAFAPDHFPEKGRYYAPCAITRGDTVEHSLLDEENDEYEYLNWYVVPALTKEPYWDNPAIGHTKWTEPADTDSVQVAYSRPLFDDEGKMYAVLAVRVSLSSIVKVVKDMKVFPASQNVLLDRKGMHITHTDSIKVFHQAVMAGIDDADMGTAKQMRDDMAEGRSGYIEYKCDGTAYYFFYRSLNACGWKLISISPAKDVIVGVERYAIWASVLAIAFLAIIVILCHMSVHRVLHPIDDITAAMRSVSRGKYDNKLVPYRYKDEIGRMCSAFAYMQKSLSVRSEKMRNEIWQQEKVDTDMRLAAFMRQNIMSMNVPLPSDMKGIDMSVRSQSAKIMAGDMYQYYTIGNKFYFLFMGVSTRGTLASIVMSTVCRLFRAELPRTNRPAQIADVINRVLAQGNSECVFVPAFIGIIDLATGEMSYCNAGHSAPLLLAPHSALAILDADPDVPIAAFPDAVYAEHSAVLQSGSILCLYSDGITDAADADMALYGEERLKEALNGNAEKDANEIVNAMMRDVQAFTGSAELKDDASIMVVKYEKIEQQAETQSEKHEA